LVTGAANGYQLDVAHLDVRESWCAARGTAGHTYFTAQWMAVDRGLTVTS
jgi:hypothetical protein